MAQASLAYFREYRRKNRESVNSWFREHNAARRKETWAKVAELKSGPCLDCGFSFASFIMEFDHRPSAVKVGDVSSLVRRSFSWERILEETQKCDLVCRRCHRLRTWGRQQTMSSGRTGNQGAKSNKKKLDKIKESPCLDCGLSFHSCQMDFDHVRGEKIGPVSQMLRGPWKLLLLEIEKCDLLCAHCHAIRTHTRDSSIAQVFLETSSSSAGPTLILSSPTL